MHTQNQDYQIVIVNNQDPLKMYSPNLEYAMRQFQFNLENLKMDIMLPEENLGFPKSCNEGARRVAPGQYTPGGVNALHFEPSEFLVFLNNDCVVHPGWLDAMIKTYESNPKTGVVGVWSNYVVGIQSVFSGMAHLEKPLWGVKMIKGICILVGAERFWEVGGFDEEYSKMGWHSDDDLSLKMMEKGYFNVISPTFVTHFGSRTFKELGVDLDTNPDILADRRRFHVKWDKVLRTVETKENESLSERSASGGKVE